MADTKISALSALTAPATDDLAVVVDISDTSMAATGTDKKITLANLVPLYCGKSTTYYTGPMGVRGNSNGLTLNRMYVYPVYLQSGTLDRIAVQNYATTATAVGRLGIYNDNGSGYPGTLLLDAGTVGLGSSSAVQAITISQAVETKLYWFAFCGQVASTPILEGFQWGTWGSALRGTDPSNFYKCGFTESSVTGALPSTFTASPGYEDMGNVNVPAVKVRYSS